MRGEGKVIRKGIFPYEKVPHEGTCIHFESADGSNRDLQHSDQRTDHPMLPNR